MVDDNHAYILFNEKKKCIKLNCMIIPGEKSNECFESSFFPLVFWFKSNRILKNTADITINWFVVHWKPLGNSKTVTIYSNEFHKGLVRIGKNQKNAIILIWKIQKRLRYWMKNISTSVSKRERGEFGLCPTFPHSIWFKSSP